MEYDRLQQVMSSNIYFLLNICQLLFDKFSLIINDFGSFLKNETTETG